MNAKRETVVEVIDESDTRPFRGAKSYRNTASEFGVLTKAASIYFEKLHDLNEASGAKKSYGSATEFLSNLDKAHRAALKHIVDNSQAHKENEKLAQRVLPDHAIDDFHRYLDDSED